MILILRGSTIVAALSRFIPFILWRFFVFLILFGPSHQDCFSLAPPWRQSRRRVWFTPCTTTRLSLQIQFFVIHTIPRHRSGRNNLERHNENESKPMFHLPSHFRRKHFLISFSIQPRDSQFFPLHTLISNYMFCRKKYFFKSYFYFLPLEFNLFWSFGFQNNIVGINFPTFLLRPRGSLILMNALWPGISLLDAVFRVSCFPPHPLSRKYFLLCVSLLYFPPFPDGRRSSGATFCTLFIGFSTWECCWKNLCKPEDNLTQSASTPDIRQISGSILDLIIC